jgi:hypothetical protein
MAAERRGPLPVPRLRRAAAAILRRVRPLFPRLDGVASDLGLARSAPLAPSSERRRDVRIHVDGRLTPLADVVRNVVEVDGVRFHREDGPEWHGCSCNHMFSRPFLEALAARLERHSLYDVLDLPFAGTALEVIWGFFPAWLGYDKWFFDGEHRVAKNPATYRREDDPEGIASYINRYYRGRLRVVAEGDYVKVRRATEADMRRLREVLPPVYFA